MKKFKILAIVFVLLTVFTLAACDRTHNKDPQDDLDVTGIEVTKMPDKVDYFVGEKFDATGMVVVKVLSDESKVEITDYTIDKTNPLNVNDTKITISYEEFTAVVNITVNFPQLQDVEFAVDEGVVYTRTMDFANFVKYRGILNNGTTTEWANVTIEDIKDYQLEGDKVIVNVEVEFDNKTYSEELSIPLKDEFISISELKSKEIDGETHYVEGIIVAMGTTMSRLEYIIWDENSKEYIGVAKLGSGSVAAYELEKNGFEIGDKVRIPVKLVRANENTVSSDSTKLYAEYTGGRAYDTAIISRGHQHQFNKENVVTISTQEELVNFLIHDNRVNNFYTMVRFVGEMRFAYYSGAEAYRFYFDEKITALADQRVDNVSPVFINANHFYTTGKKAVELLFGTTDEYKPSFTNPGVIQKEVYALFMGGNTYYHQFIILSEDDIADVQKVEVGKEFVAPVNLLYPLGTTLDLTGGKVLVKFNFGSSQEIPLTLEMLDQETLPNMNIEGKYTVTGSYEGFTFSFEVEVLDKQIESLVLSGELSKTTFNHRDNLLQEVLAELLNMKLTATYVDGEKQTIAINESMVSLVDGWTLGNNTVRITFLDKYYDITVVVESTAISVSEFIQKEDYEVFDVHGIIIGPSSSQGFIELLMMDRVTGEIIGISNSGVAGSTSEPSLDSQYLKPGDEVIVRMEVRSQDSSVNVGKKRGNGVGNSASNFRENIIVVSTDNELNISPEKLVEYGYNIPTISSQEELTNFIQRPDRFYQVVKLEGPIYIARYGGFLRIFFDESITALGEQKVEVDGQSASPVLHNPTTQFYYEDGLEPLIKITHEDGETINFTKPGIFYHTVYAIFMGGNSYYHIFNVIDESWIELATPQEVGKEFIQPEKLIYQLGNEFDLTGGKVIIKYNFGPDKEVELTLEMLDQETLPSMNEAGEYTITGTYEGFTFTFTIEVIGKQVESVSLQGILEKSIFGLRDDVRTEVLNQLLAMELTVHYDNNTQENVEITEEMITMENEWQIGDITFRITFLEKYVDVTVTVENTAISVSEFLQKKVGEVYDVQGIIIGPASSAAFIELLMMDKVTGEILGVSNSGVAGSSSEPNLDTNFVRSGDEVIVTLEVADQQSSVNVGKKRGNAIGNNSANFKNSIIIVSTNNVLDLSPEKLIESGVEIVTITNQQELHDFIQRSDRFYKVVKLVGPIYVARYKGYLRFYFDESITLLADQRIEVDGQSSSPVLHTPTADFYYENTLTSIFEITHEDGETISFAAPAITQHTIYATLMGGNDYYHVFNVIDPSWIVNTQE